MRRRDAVSFAILKCDVHCAMSWEGQYLLRRVIWCVGERTAAGSSSRSMMMAISQLRGRLIPVPSTLEYFSSW